MTRRGRSTRRATRPDPSPNPRPSPSPNPDPNPNPNPNPHPNPNQGLPIAAFPGGVLCRDAANNVVGAIAVSGASSDEDEHCAILGAHAVGLLTEPAQSRLA